MTVAKATRKTKPEKPHAGFPLTASTNGSWVKKIKGKVYSFGRWDDPDGAHRRYLNEVEHISK